MKRKSVLRKSVLRKSVLLIVILVIIIPCKLNAGGTNFNPLFGARALSLNGLYFAGSDALNNIWTNPAGLSFLSGRGIGISGIDRIEELQFDSPSGGLFRSFREDDITLAGGLYWNLHPGFTVALGYSPVVNYSVNWPFASFKQSDSLSAIQAFSLLNNIKVSSISPSAGLTTGGLAVGLSVNFYRVSQQTAFPVNNAKWAGGRGLAAYQFTYNQSAWTFGVNLGLQADLSDVLRIGATVHSGYKASLKGNASSQMFADLDSAVSNPNLTSTFQFPWVFGLGVTYKLNPSLTLNMDAAYSLWKDIKDNFIFSFDNATWQQSLSEVDSLTGFKGSNLVFTTRNTIDAGFGLEYGTQDGYAFRLGYRFSMSPVESSAYSLLFPVVDQHWVSLGLGYHEESYSVDAGLAYVIGAGKDVTRLGLPGLSGKYSSSSLIPSLTAHFSL